MAALLAPNYLRSVQQDRLYLKVPPAALLLVNSELMFYGRTLWYLGLFVANFEN